jgi:uncharacterized protein YjbI with pentapeptide repeats
MSEQPQRPTTEDRDAWRAYWQAQGMPWRTEPEIDDERQRFLAARRAVTPDIDKGIYPFGDENGSTKLTRADVEWLLATHVSEGKVGPVSWDEEAGKTADLRSGLDLRAADLSGISLRRLPLTGLRGGLTFSEWTAATVRHEHAALRLEHADLSEAHLEGAFLERCSMERVILFDSFLQRAFLRRAHMERAHLGGAHLEGADLNGTYLMSANLSGVHLAGAKLLDTFLSAGTDLTDVEFVDAHHGPAWIIDVRWDDTNVAKVLWSQVRTLGHEVEARQRRGISGKVKTRTTRIQDFEAAARANRQLAIVLRSQGLSDQADRFSYQANTLQRTARRLQRRYVRFVGSFLLNLVSGYGYRPLRSFLAYAVVILGFMGLYLLTSQFVAPHLTWNEALVLSMSSFHGRGFFNPSISLGDTYAQLAAAEAFVGLMIEITFIATFTQRFFAR